MAFPNKRIGNGLQLQNISRDAPTVPWNLVELGEQGKTILPFNPSDHLSIGFQVWLLNTQKMCYVSQVLLTTV